MGRYLEKSIKSDLGQKMVFLSGPRQTGKTTLAKALISDPAAYLNWDTVEGRKAILTGNIPTAKIVVFDELHKYRTWRKFLKGLYDDRGEKQKYLVTGSAKLDFYRFGGDTLQGRYFSYRLHPFSFRELELTKQRELESLLLLGGFPEPYSRQSATYSRRWSENYRARLIEEEITKVEQIKDLGKLELLMLRLPELVGSPLSLNGLREDLELSHEAVTRWVDILERFYGIFRISPFGSPKLKSIKKAQKHYHYDWTLIQDPGARFENLVAAHLLKWIDYQLDVEGHRYELRYFRDSDENEVDFVITDGRSPIQFIECKLTAESTPRALRLLKRKFPKVEAKVVVLNGSKEYRTKDGVVIIPATKFLSGLV